MRFHSAAAALRWWARHGGDGVRARWPDPARVPTGRRTDPADVHLVAVAIERALAGLREPQRRLLAWYYLADVPVMELATKLERAPSTIYGQLTRAVAALTNRLRAEELLAHRED